MKDRISIVPIAVALLLAVPAVLVGFGASHAQGLFAPPVHYPSGGAPHDVMAADIDLDGWPDLVVVTSSGFVRALLNRGDGTFEESSHSMVGSQPQAGCVLNLDDDQYPDIVVTNSGSGDLSVLRNRGDGTFEPAIHYAVGNSPWGVVSEDLNGDMLPDVAVVLRGSLNVVLLMNDGAGSLVPGGSLYAGGAYTKPSWLVAADLDADEDADIVVVKNYQNLYFREGYIEIFGNDGAGNFTSRGTTTIGRAATTPMAVDLDGDEDLDLAISGFVDSSYKLSVLLNDGAGHFEQPVAHYAAADGRACAGDFDADGDIDVAISSQGVSASSFSVLLNHGDATFAGAFTVGTGEHPMGMIAEDLDRDNDTDVAVAVSDENLVAVAMSTADPTTAVGAANVARPQHSLGQNHPNPFNPRTTILYDLPRAASIKLTIQDAHGRTVRILERGLRGPGSHRAIWDGKNGHGVDAVGGIYFYRLEAGSVTEQRKMVLLK